MEQQLIFSLKSNERLKPLSIITTFFSQTSGRLVQRRAKIRRAINRGRRGTERTFELKVKWNITLASLLAMSGKLNKKYTKSWYVSLFQVGRAGGDERQLQERAQRGRTVEDGVVNAAGARRRRHHGVQVILNSNLNTLNSP